jgi:peptidoglycan/LPS O-acetylase OafA/YrhL
MAFIQLIALILEQQLNLRAQDIDSYWAWILFLPVILAACWGMYFLGEKQCNELLRRMSKSRQKAPV